jgi:ABC-2 type transport system permease protein
MNKVLVVAINDLRVYFADRGNYVLFVMPVIMALVLGFATGGGFSESELPVDVIDMDNTPESAHFLQTLREVNSAIFLCPFDDGVDDRDCRLAGFDAEALTLEDSRDRVDRYLTNGVIIIPEGYGASMSTFAPVAIEYHSDHSPTSGNAVLQALETAVQRVNAAVVAARVGDGVAGVLDADLPDLAGNVFQNAEALWTESALRVTYATSEGEEDLSGGPTGFNQSVPGMGTMFVLMTVLVGMVMLVNERNNWTLQRVVMMPVSRSQILAGKILSRFLLGIITFTLLIIVGTLVGVNFGSNPLGIALIVIVYTLCVTALAFAIAPLLRTEMQVSAIANLLGIVLAALGGAWWPLEIVPDFMRTIAHISPISWAMNSFNELIFYGGGLGDIVVNLGVLLAATVVLFGIGVMNFKYE